MTILIDVQQDTWMTSRQFADALREHLPGADLRVWPEIGTAADIRMLATVAPARGRIRTLPNLELIQKLGAGVESILDDPDLPGHIRVARLKPDAPAREIAEYCVAYVLREQRNMDFHDRNQTRGSWEPVAPRNTPECTVGVLGLGHIGARTAAAFAQLGFKVAGWSRSPKDLENVECHHGDAALGPLLGQCDFVVCVLPSTPATRGLFDAEMLRRMRPGSVLINVGRGDLVVDEDLVNALDSGQVARAVLDVFRTEPLPPDHPFWTHPGIVVTPHVSGWRITGGTETVAENYRRLMAGRPLLHEIDRSRGY